jgi:hypothetical protein
MPSSVMSLRVAPVRTDVSDGCIASIIIVTIICELGTTIAVTSLRSVLRLLVTAYVVPSSPIPVTLIMEATRFSETLVLTRATRRNILEEGILHSQLQFVQRSINV